MLTSLLRNNSASLNQVNESKKNGSPTKKPRIVRLIVTLATFCFSAIQALVSYIVFRVKAIKNCRPALQAEAKKVTAVVSAQAPTQTPLLQGNKKQNPQVESSNPKATLFRELPIDIHEEAIFQELKDNGKKLKAEIQTLDPNNKKIIDAVLDDIQSVCEKKPEEFPDKEKALLVRERLIKAIKIVGLNCELKRRGFATSPYEFEIALLEYLGYNINEAYSDKEYLYSVISQTVLNSIDQQNISCLDDVRRFFGRTCFKVRLEQVNITDPKKIEKLYLSILYISSFLKNIPLKKLKIPEDCFAKRFPILIKDLKQMHRKLQRKLINQTFAVFLKNQKFEKVFEDPNVHPAGIEKFFAQQDWNGLEKLLTAQLDELSLLKLENSNGIIQKRGLHIKEHLAFMKDFGSYLTYEFVQGGVDSNEVHGMGVCHSLVMQLIRDSIASPQKSPLEIKPTINSKTRFNQTMSLFKKKISLKRSRDFSHNNFHAKEQFEILLSKNFQKDLKNKIFQFRNNFESSSGWAYVSLAFGKESLIQKMKEFSTHETARTALKENPTLRKEFQMDEARHAIAYRIDVNKKNISFFDPIIGYFSFDQIENGEGKLIECLNRLIQLHYPDLVSFSVISLSDTKKESQQKPTTL